MLCRDVVAIVVFLSCPAPSVQAADDSRPRPVPATAERPAVLPPLYAIAAGFHAYDVYSTFKVLDAGGFEANPAMRSVTTHPALFIGVKAGVATFTIATTERMWKGGHRIEAVAMMVLSNVVLSWVAVHNQRVLSDSIRHGGSRKLVLQSSSYTLHRQAGRPHYTSFRIVKLTGFA